EAIVRLEPAALVGELLLERRHLAAPCDFVFHVREHACNCLSSRRKYEHAACAEGKRLRAAIDLHRAHEGMHACVGSECRDVMAECERRSAAGRELDEPDVDRLLLGRFRSLFDRLHEDEKIALFANDVLDRMASLSVFNDGEHPEWCAP